MTVPTVQGMGDKVMNVWKSTVRAWVLAGAIAVASTGASAHSTSEATTPADGAVLTAPPAAIGMDFDAPMRITLIRLTDTNGTEYAVTRNDGMAPVTAFEASPDTLPPGIYTVEWRGLASDGHAMEGRFSFEVAE